MDWVKINTAIIDDMEVQTLPSRKFLRLFLAAVRGEENVVSRFVRPCNGRPACSEWIVIRNRIFRRDDFTCRYCGKRGGRLECDHVVPVSRGGPSVDSNLVTACFKCNRSKRTKLLSEWSGAEQNHEA